MTVYSKKITSFPVNRSNPFLNDTSYTTDSEDFSITLNSQEMVVRNFIGINKSSQSDILDKIVELIGDKLSITKAGLNLIKYIYINAKFDEDNDSEFLPIKIDYRNSMVEMGYNSIQSVYTALLELLEKKIIARTAVEKIYFINPVFFIPAKKILITEYYKIVKEK